MEQLHRIKMARYYTLFNVSEVFSFRISDQRMFSHSVIKVAEVFSYEVTLQLLHV